MKANLNNVILTMISLVGATSAASEVKSYVDVKNDVYCAVIERKGSSMDLGTPAKIESLSCARVALGTAELMKSEEVEVLPKTIKKVAVLRGSNKPTGVLCYYLKENEKSDGPANGSPVSCVQVNN